MCGGEKQSVQTSLESYVHQPKFEDFVCLVSYIFFLLFFGGGYRISLSLTVAGLDFVL